MKKKLAKRLRITRETLGDLNPHGLEPHGLKKAAGGNTSGLNCTIFCDKVPNPTYYCCPTG